MKFSTRTITASVFILAVLTASIMFFPSREGDSRWFTKAQIDLGSTLFLKKCALCHGNEAEATADWKKSDNNGNYPPPPLNGTAHAWHHSKLVLTSTIKEGGAKLGGLMPGFGNQLSDSDIEALIAYFQSKWPDHVYKKWAERFKVNN